MKHLTLGLVFMAFIGTVAAQYNAETYNQKAFEKSKISPQKWGGYLTIQAGVSPSHPDVFLGASVGVSYEYTQISASITPALKTSNLIVYNAMAGYRFPINKLFTIVPKVGGWVYSEEGGGISWRGENHLCYGLEFHRKTEGNIEFVVEGIDYRGQKYNGMKVITVGIKYVLGKKK